MRKATTAVIGGVLAFAFAALTAPDALHAQEQAETAQQECTAEVKTNPVPAGEQAVALEIQLSQEIGELTGITAPDGSGVALASPDDLAKTDMARQETEGQPQPIQMAAGNSRSATVWVNTADATPGSYQISFDSEQNSCIGTVKVNEATGR